MMAKMDVPARQREGLRLLRMLAPLDRRLLCRLSRKTEFSTELGQRARIKRRPARRRTTLASFGDKKVNHRDASRSQCIRAALTAVPRDPGL